MGVAGFNTGQMWKEAMGRHGGEYIYSWASNTEKNAIKQMANSGVMDQNLLLRVAKNAKVRIDARSKPGNGYAYHNRR